MAAHRTRNQGYTCNAQTGQIEECKASEQFSSCDRCIGHVPLPHPRALRFGENPADLSSGCEPDRMLRSGRRCTHGVTSQSVPKLVPSNSRKRRHLMGEAAYLAEGSGSHSHGQNRVHMNTMKSSIMDKAHRGDLSDLSDDSFEASRSEETALSCEVLSAAPRQVREPAENSIASARKAFTVSNGVRNQGSRTPLYWERRSAELSTRAHSTERFFIIETGSAVADGQSPQQADLESGLELAQPSAFRRIASCLSQARHVIFRAGGLRRLSATSRKKVQYLVCMVTFAGACTCVSVLSVARTNSLVITAAITFILAMGKLVCDVLADHPGDGVGVP